MENEQLQKCINMCWHCRHACQKTLFNHCLKAGGAHAQQDRVKLMIDCIQICQIAADFMTRHSRFHQHICAACAEICQACAESCEQVGDDCAETCRNCAESCREMSKV